jgi:hypothetical protein
MARELQENPVNVFYIVDETLRLHADTSKPPKSKDMYLSILGSNNLHKGLVKCVEATLDPEC